MEVDVNVGGSGEEHQMEVCEGASFARKRPAGPIDDDDEVPSNGVRFERYPDLDPEQRILIRKEKFKERLDRFDKYCKVTGLSVRDIGWPMIRGRNTQKCPLTSVSYSLGDWAQSNYNFENFTPQAFLDLTWQQLNASGGIHEYDAEIVKFVFQRVMKTVSAYCNIAYESAKRRGRRKITSCDINEMMISHRLRWYMYMHKFLPYPNPEQVIFNNEHTKLLHKHYFLDIGASKDIFDSEQLDKEITDRGQRLALNCLRRLHDFGDIHRQYFSKVNYVNPLSTFYSRFHAYRLHEALGMPPLETELITVFDWLARITISEIAYKTILWCDARGMYDFPTFESYQMAMVGEGDPLFNFEIDYSPRHPRRVMHPMLPYPKFEKRGKPPRNPEVYYKRIRMLCAFNGYRADFCQFHYTPKYFMSEQVFPCDGERAR